MKTLTFRETEVRDLVVRGLSNQEIADRLFVSEKTIKFHLTTIYEVERVKSRAQLIVKHLKDPDRVTPAEAKTFKEFLK